MAAAAAAAAAVTVASAVAVAVGDPCGRRRRTSPRCRRYAVLGVRGPGRV